MEHKYNTVWGFTCGLVGGTGKLVQMYGFNFLQINTFNFWDFGMSLTKAGLTALVCGYLGLLGKWLWEKTVSLFKKEK